MKLLRVSLSVLGTTVLAVLAGCAGLKLGATGLHDTSRTGKVHDINIVGNEITPANIVAQPGDEIRWVNHRTASIRIAFTDPLHQKLSCERNFGIGHSTRIEANDAASLCFLTPGTLKYMVRMEASVPGNEIIVPGSIEIATSLAIGEQNQEMSSRSRMRPGTATVDADTLDR